MLPNKKSSILLVLRVLEEFTDEDHYLTQTQIVDKIKQEYGIEVERKSVGYSLSLLEELEYDIVKGSKGGVSLLARTLDKTEASFIIDAVFSSRSIDGRMAQKISNAVSSCFSRYQRQDYSYVYKSCEVTRTNNKEVFYNISIIQEAIKQGKRIGFQYLTYDSKGNSVERNNGYQYIVSPYYLINNFGRYYLLCNYREKYRAIQIFRLDYMVNIEIKNDWNIKKIHELKDGPQNFSISKYINDHVYLLDGETIEAELELDGEWCIQYVKDWFGNNASICEKDEKIHAYIKCNEKALFYWVMQYSDCVKVVGPLTFIEKIKNGLKTALSKYE